MEGCKVASNLKVAKSVPKAVGDGSVTKGQWKVNAVEEQTKFQNMVAYCLFNLLHDSVGNVWILIHYHTKEEKKRKKSYWPWLQCIC